MDDFNPSEPYSGEPPSFAVEMAFSPDGKVLAVKTRDRFLAIDAESGHVIKESGAKEQFEQYKAADKSQADMLGVISPDGKTKAQVVIGQSVKFTEATH